MRAAGRKAIAEAQRKRWAAAKGQAETKAPIVAKPVKKRRVLSAAGKAAIVAALKKCLAIERESQAQCLGRLFFACSLQAMASASGAEKGPGEKGVIERALSPDHARTEGSIRGDNPTPP